MRGWLFKKIKEWRTKKKIEKPKMPPVKEEAVTLRTEDFDEMAKVIGKKKVEKIFDYFSDLQVKVAKLESGREESKRRQEKTEKLRKDIINQHFLRRSRLLKSRVLHDLQAPYNTKVISIFSDEDTPENSPFYVEKGKDRVQYPYLVGYAYQYDEQASLYGPFVRLRLSKTPRAPQKGDHEIMELPLCYDVDKSRFMDFSQMLAFGIVKINLKPDGSHVPQHIEIEPSANINEIEDKDSKRLLKLKLKELPNLDPKSLEKAFITLWKQREVFRCKYAGETKKSEEMMDDRNRYARIARALASTKQGDSAVNSKILGELNALRFQMKIRDTQDSMAEYGMLGTEMFAKGLLAKSRGFEDIGRAAAPQVSKKQTLAEILTSFDLTAGTAENPEEPEVAPKEEEKPGEKEVEEVAPPEPVAG